MRRKGWLPLGSQRTRDLIFTLGSLSSFREKNLQMTFNCKGKTSITWADILEGMNCLIKASAANPISHGIHSLGHLCNWLTAFIFLNVLFYIGVNKAYVLLVLLIIFWDSSCKLGNKLRRQRILRLLPNHPKWNSKKTTKSVSQQNCKDLQEFESPFYINLKAFLVISLLLQ